jgi:zinc protease
MSKKLWGDLYSRKNVIGDHDIILTATREKMETIQKKYYYPNNSILILAGDLDHTEGFKQAEQIFGDWQPSDFDPFVKYPIPEFKPLQKSDLYFTENSNARNPIIAISYHGPDTRNDLKATYAADVFSFIMGQKSSKLQQELVDSGLAFDIGVNYQTCKYTGPILIFAVPNPEKVKEVRDKLEEHVAQWDSDNYFTDEQLATAKTLLAIDDAHSREKTSEFIHTVSYWWASASIGYYTSYVDNIKKVTRADIQAYIRKYIKGKPHVTGILTTPESRPALEASLKSTKN